MKHFKDILNEIELHDSSLISLKLSGDGSMELEIDFDEVWNESVSKYIRGLLFNSVYEISEFKIDRLNIIGTVEVTEIENYNKEFVTNDTLPELKTLLISFEFVAGGNLLIVCSDSVEYLK